MPRYDYHCTACENTQEISHGINSSVAVTCPKCKTQKLKRLISPVPSHFKGSGWAKDGYS